MISTQPHHKLTGLVIARYGQQVDIEINSGNIQRLYLKRSLSDIVTGDNVLLKHQADNWMIVEHLPRTSVLAVSSKKKPIAANIDQLLLVIAPQPAPTFALIDDYLVMAEALAIKPVIVFNKLDLLNKKSLDSWRQKLHFYQDLSYPLVFISSINPQQMRDLNPILTEKTSILVGQSGVGKSSMIQQLMPDSTVRIGQLCDKNQHGKHTTTTARLYHLSCGGNLIDSPGVRSFSIETLSAEKISRCFIEFMPYLGQCRFNNCRHQTEPDCAILAAIKTGDITETRYNNYQRLMENARKSGAYK